MHTCAYTKSCELRMGPGQSQGELRQAWSPFCRCRNRARGRPCVDDARSILRRRGAVDHSGRDVLGRLVVLVYTWRGESVRLSTRNIMKREYDFRKAKRGAVVSVPRGKTRITIRLDDEILAWFRDQVELAGGGNYQTVINEVLRQHIQRAQEPLERTLRRVIREEIRRAS